VDFVQQFSQSQGAGILAQLTGQLGFDASQAQAFLPAAVGRVLDVLKGGKLDPSALLSGDPTAELVSAVDIGALAGEAGVDEGKASAGLQSLLPTLLESLQGQAGGAAGIASLLGGGEAGGGLAGKLGGLAGGLFKK
jgi:hypothetical protein